MTPVLEFDAVTKTYGPGLFDRRSVTALDAVSFAVPAGCTLGLVGPNRAGKTTVNRLALALARPTKGRVLRFGEPAGRRDTLARVGYVHESHAFPLYYSARSLLGLHGALAGMPAADIPKRADAVLALVGLADRAAEPISRFSKGMLQRLGIAQAVLAGPDLLVLDEPSEGLDHDGRRVLADLVRGRHAEGRTTVFVSHVLADVERLCDRLLALKAGRVLYDGPTAGLTKGRPLEDALPHLYETGRP